MQASRIEDEISRHYAAVRSATPNSGLIAVLHIGAEQTALAVGDLAEPEAIVVLAIGSKATAREYFKNTPPTALELENAIVTVEDELARARSSIPDDSPLYTTDAALCEVARLSGVNKKPTMVLSIEAMEQTFDRMASIAQGRPASRSGLPASNEFSATLLILRECMHHLRFSAMSCIA